MTEAENTTQIRVSKHAVERFSVRLRQGLDFDEAERQLCALVLQTGLIVHDIQQAPFWMRGLEGSNVDSFVLIGDDIVLPIRNAVATTLITRDQAQQRRKKRRKRR